MLDTQTLLRVLRALVPSLACTTCVLVPIALSGSHWLYTTERFPNPAYSNGTSREHYLYKKTVSGLFLLCQTAVGEETFNCSTIDYFGQDTYSPDPNDSTMAIPYTAVRASPFFLLAVVVLVLAETLCLSGTCRTSDSSRLCTLTAGVVFIIQGLMMMLGCLTYIATLKGEVWEKLQTRSTYSEPIFRYGYGRHFGLLIASFTAAELTGFCSVMFFIYWHKSAWKQSLMNPSYLTPHNSALHSLLMLGPPATPVLTSSERPSFSSSIPGCPVMLESHHKLVVPSVYLPYWQQRAEKPAEQQNVFVHNSSCRGQRDSRTAGESSDHTMSEAEYANVLDIRSDHKFLRDASFSRSRQCRDANDAAFSRRHNSLAHHDLANTYEGAKQNSNSAKCDSTYHKQLTMPVLSALTPNRCEVFCTCCCCRHCYKRALAQRTRACVQST